MNKLIRFLTAWRPRPPEPSPPPAPTAPRPLPPAPEGWNKTLSNLFAEMNRGERPSVGFPESEWARNYERSLLAGMRYPCQGDVYEALAEIPCSFLTAWAAPFTGGGEGTLYPGERIWIEHEPSPEPISAYAIPLDYHALEQRMVPAADRTARKYGGFYLCVSTHELNTLFRLVETGRKSAKP